MDLWAPTPGAARSPDLGPDVDPKSGINFIKYVNEKFIKYGAVLASVIGRFYAMDRDKRWERIKKSYDLLINGKGINLKI